MALAADADGAAALARAGCRLIATSAVVSQGAYRFFDERCVMGVSGASAEIEDPSVVAARLLAACEVQPASELWVIAGPGLADLPVDLVETKLRALTDGTRQARLWLAKEQFDRDWGPS